MTTFTIQLADGRTAQVVGDECTTRQDGSLWILEAVAPKPAALAPVAIFARGQWLSCFPDDAAVLWQSGPTPDTVTAPTTPRFA